MKLFLDTNIVIDYLAKRQPFAEDVCQMVMLCCQKNYELCVSSLSFATVYHVLRKQYAHEHLLALLSDITGLFSIAAVDGKIVQDALSSNFTDFEDAIQCYTAVADNADVIVTRNVKDFGPSPLLVKTPAEICELLLGYGTNNVPSSLVNEPVVSYGDGREQ